MRREAEAGGGSQQDKALIDFLKTKRWFGDKGREIRAATLMDEIPVRWPNSTRPFTVARARVETDAGESVYQLFLQRSDPLEESLSDQEFLRGIADVWVAGATFEQRDARWIVERETAQPLVVPPSGRIRLASGEQTNSSVILNDQAILKLFRKLELGINPDVEVTRFLTIERRFVNVPALLGTIRFEDENGTTIAGMLQEFVPGAVDAWTYVVGQLKSLTAEPDEQRWKTFDREITQLGEVTRALHENLASGESTAGFGMARATRRDLDAWIGSAKRTIESATAALRRTLDEGHLPREYKSHAQCIVRDLPRRLALLERLPIRDGTDFGASVRTHGDYHLGQVLRSAAGQFLVIDFEGEPARPLAERRARTSPLRDVAGMLRSFAYAAAVAATDRHASGEQRNARTRESYQRMRKRFLAGYQNAGGGVPDLLPPLEGELLLPLFEEEKQFYEVKYELDHRPDWLWVPLHDLPVFPES